MLMGRGLKTVKLRSCGPGKYLIGAEKGNRCVTSVGFALAGSPLGFKKRIVVPLVASPPTKLTFHDGMSHRTDGSDDSGITVAMAPFVRNMFSVEKLR